jgi:repressor LexA
MLSTRQRQILQVIQEETAAKGRSPSLRRIGTLTGLNSPASVHGHLRALEEQGYLRQVPGKQRLIEVNFTGEWADPERTPHNTDQARRGSTSDMQLTSRQRRVLEVVHDTIADRGYPPSMREIGEAVGLASTSSVHSQIEALQRKGFIRRDPTKPRAIEVHLDDPVGAVPRPLPTYVPLMSAPVAAGTGTLPEDVVEELLPLPRELVGQGQLFMLQVRGDSMVDAGVLDRDYVVVRRQNADNKDAGREEDLINEGDIVVALLPNDESEATVKYFSRQGGRVRLLPANPAFEPIDGDQAQLLGKVVTVLRRLR